MLAESIKAIGNYARNCIAKWSSRSHPLRPTRTLFYPLAAGLCLDTCPTDTDEHRRRCIDRGTSCNPDCHIASAFCSVALGHQSSLVPHRPSMCASLSVSSLASSEFSVSVMLLPKIPEALRICARPLICEQYSFQSREASRRGQLNGHAPGTRVESNRLC